MQLYIIHCYQWLAVLVVMVTVVCTPHFLEVAEVQGEGILERIGTVVLYPKLSTCLLDNGSDPKIVRLQYTCRDNFNGTSVI